MKAPAFWSRPSGLAARLLSPIAAIYGAVAARRLARPGAAAAVPVICIGNVTAGGAGKTPAALAVASLLIEAGERPVFLARGYGGRLAGPTRVDPARHGFAEVGDEALLLARVAPTIVARDRVAGARLCVEAGATVLVMDDGLQNPSLAKDFAFAVFDAGSGIGNGRCLPAGPLRAPLDAQWPLVDAAILVGEGAPGTVVAALAAELGFPVLRAHIAPSPTVSATLQGQDVLAFAGIGRPSKFFDTLAACGATVRRNVGFADHHTFRAGEISALLDEARASGLVPVTTEKDFVRLSALREVEPRLAEIVALPIRLVFERSDTVRTLVSTAIETARAQRSDLPCRASTASGDT